MLTVAPIAFRLDGDHETGRMAWITGIVEDVLLAYWIHEIYDSSDGTLSPEGVEALAYIVDESLYGKNPIH